MKRNLAIKLLALLFVAVLLGACTKKSCPAYSQVEVSNVETRA